MSDVLERLGEFAAAETLMDGQAVPDVNLLERILNGNQMAGVDFLERGLLAARAVARVQIRGRDGALQGHGSGVLISPRLFMTNNHVLASHDDAAASMAQFGYLLGVDGLPRDPENYSFAPDILFLTDEALDYTIVALAPQAHSGQILARRGWCSLIPGSGKALVSERVNIIQHPGGERMQIAIRENTIVAVVEDFLQYETDTRPGSSGSPVFNEQWEMAALHHAGVPKRNSAGRILMQGDVPWTGLEADVHKIIWVANEGVRISRIVADVNQQALSQAQAELWHEAFSPPPYVSVWDRLEQHSDPNGGGENSFPGVSYGPEAGDYGQSHWDFRLSFGPLQRAIPHLSGPGQAPAPRPLSVSSAGSSRGSLISARDVAHGIFERFQHDGPYYDASADQVAAQAYWQDVDWQAPAATLFPQLTLHLAETHHTQLSYRRARHEFLYPAIDLHDDGRLRNIYSGTPFDALEALTQEIESAIAMAASMGRENILDTPEILLEDDTVWEALEENSSLQFNCEHVVPQSWFDKRQPMKADIHHLFACEPGCNSFRSNIPYWDFDPTDEVERDLCGRREGNKFEPENGKGAVARATFYFLLRYPGEVGNVRTELTKSRLPHLLRWHQTEPVTEYERHRNWLTEIAQGNRNPFIDQPDAASVALLTLGFSSS